MREVRSMHIGPFNVHETEKICPLEECQKTYRYAGLDHFLPRCSNFGYDVVEYIGYAVWRESRTAQEIKTILQQQHNLTICESEIAILARKFVNYMVEAQKDKQPEIKHFLRRGGGFFLYFDAMHPGDGAAHLMCAVAEEIANKVQVVLGSAKLPTESTETAAAFLRELKEKYGNPLAGICDMLASNLAAFKEVFPEVQLLICHFHFLRSVGKNFLEYENTKLQGTLKQYDITKLLKKFLMQCKESIEANPKLAAYLTYSEAEYRSAFHSLPEPVKAYCKTLWILAYEQELNGYGFPFDRSDLVYLQRMKKVYDSLRECPHDSKELLELKMLLANILEDSDLKKNMVAMEKKVEDFDRLRAIMKIAPAEGGKGLNDDGEECNMTMMEKQLKAFIESDTIKKQTDKDYKKMINQIRKYWKMLFAKPVEVRLPNGEVVHVYPQRTSNLMERLFREFQRLEYKRTGMGTLSRTVCAMIAETPMMKNLECPEYMDIILNGQPNLAGRFAELDKAHFQERIKQPQDREKLPAALKKISKDPNFHKIFIKSTKKEKKAA